MAQINKPNQYFNTILYSGTGSENARTGVNFQPDWVWIKQRNGSTNQMLTDSVRGATKTLHSQNTDAESTDAQALKSFNSDGFTVGTDTDVNGAGGTGGTYVAWNWKAGTSFTNDASATGIGSIDSAGSVNTDARFSIINVVKNNTTAHTVAHGLGAVPQMIIGKSRTGGSYRWIVYHQAIGNTKAQYLNENFADTTSSTFWNDTTPTSSVFSLGTDNSWNGTNIFYCFAEKQGYSKFSSFVGNGNADGTFIYTGFKPAFVIIKASSTAQSWQMSDNKRDTFNAVDHRLRPNESSAESTSPEWIDFCSNGFKLRNNDVAWNGSGQTYIYMAFAENPLVGTNNIPATAR